MRRLAGGVAVVVCAFGLLFGGLFFLVLGAGQPAQDQSTGSLGSKCSLSVGDAGKLPSLTPEQSHNANIIIQQAAKDLPRKDVTEGSIVAIATAYQESTLRNLDYGDRDSLGIFQQRTAWGPRSVRENVAASAHLFFTGGQAGQRGLLDVPGWAAMSVPAAAQAVQVSFDGSLYGRWVGLATKVVAAVLKDSNVQPVSDVACQQNVPGGSVVMPIAASAGARDDHNFGGTGSHWASIHTGDDFSVACGTPVRAVTGGRIIIENGPSWYGNWLVKVSTGKGKLTTWYAHMQKVLVTDGQVVKPGQVIGQVGALGNATGCHLHLEVHPHGGTIYEDPIAPSPWLASNVGKALA